MNLVFRVGLLVAGLFCSSAFPAAAAQTPAQLQDLDAFITEEMAKEKLPGLAIAIVKDGELIYQRGFGYRDVERKLPVTPDTAFPIASVSKSFAVLTLGSLVQQGKLEWDRPVREYLPDFRLYDPASSALMTPRDLVSHRSGLPRHDAVWYGSTASRRELWDGLRYLQPNADLRARYQYNNLMYVAAGYLAGELSGGTWEELVRQKVFTPLGMTGSSTSLKELRASRQPALGYVKAEKDQVVRKDYANIDAIAPAGAINSTLADMSRYLMLHLGDGSVGGRRIFDAAVLNEMRMPNIADPAPSKDPEFSRMEYGMGLFLNTYRGHRHVYHGGNIDGFTSFLSYLPEQGVGVVMLSNLGGSQLRNILPYRIYDRLLGLPDIDWSGRLAQRRALDKSSEVDSDLSGDAERSPPPSLRRAGTQPSRSLADYAGDYVHPAYGTAVVGATAQGLTLSFHGAKTPLEHYHYDVFRAPADELNSLEKEFVQFHASLDGDLEALSIPFESTVPAIRFARAPDPGMRERAFLQAFVGSYRLGAGTAEVRLRDDGALVVSLDGQSLTLSPLSGTRFAIDGRQSQSIEFLKDGAGKVTRFVQYQPWGNRVAQKR